MKLLVVSHKLCWASPTSPLGYATDGGFPVQMQALSELFDETVLLVPCLSSRIEPGQMALTGHNLSVVPLTPPAGPAGLWRKLGMLSWFVRNGAILLGEVLRADAVHTPIPGDVGTIGMLLAFIMRKPLFVRHCGNWLVQTTRAEHFWKWFMERFAGGRNVMLVTGGGSELPSFGNPNIRWIFSTSLREDELKVCHTRRELLQAEQARLIIACRQQKNKGTGVVIESLPIILKIYSEVRLDVLGNGPALTEFKELAARMGVSNRTHFHGKVEHHKVIRFFQQADLFCYPTASSEGFPKVVHEALACGLPVVTTCVSVLPQLIGTGCGMLIEEATPEAVARAVHNCLADTTSYSAMSVQAIETAKHYSLETWRDTIGDLLQAAWGPLQTNA